MIIRGDYTKFAPLEQLAPLVRKQRRLEKLVADAEAAIAQEKAVREAIDKLLVDAGIKSGEAVLCKGYEVAHNERRGRTSLNADKLRGAGVAELDIQFATETGNPSKFATVKPAKGSKVR